MHAIAMTPNKYPWTWSVFLLMAICPLTTNAQNTDCDSELKFALVFSRHGVRSPTKSNEAYAKYAVDPWPTWPSVEDPPERQPGDLTPHGKELMTLLGKYYRDYFKREKLFTDEDTENGKNTCVYADNSERTMRTAEGLVAGLFPSYKAEIHSVPKGQTDPLFHPVKAGLGNPDHVTAAAVLASAIGKNPGALRAAYHGQLSLLQAVLFNQPPDTDPLKVPPSKTSVQRLPISISPGLDEELVNFEGSISVASTLAEIFILEYAENFPTKDVGFGRLNRDLISRISQLHTTDFDIKDRTLGLAEVQGSNLAQHILNTLIQASSGTQVPGAIGSPSDRLALLVGHDDNLASIAGLLNLSWMFPGFQLNDTPPGGAMVIELRKPINIFRGDNYFVRVYYVSQTLDQMREATPLTLLHPPVVSPIFIPGGSCCNDGYEIPLSVFKTLVELAIDRRFVKD
jgi:4-phytase / acid phosphatase